MSKKRLGNVWMGETCPIRQVLDRFGDKWSILIIELLSQEGKLRFSEIAQTIGDISQKMLTVTLRSLESDGLVTRRFYPEIPPRVEYELSDLGRSLVPHIEQLTGWGQAHMATIMENRRLFEAKRMEKN
ncbi:winged helix-turn-helix transcriptional regulator [Chitinophaga rhizophila]|uniref:Helix-turn-helix transcriptional regulator n=1 Tax=Chitinophaga rhizophila TaxID=2866212 RepID=A0ABS7GKK3_9BACT|nr:helix-turn-helix domain-containing protein [Chitinophaga rhizophila]MBW8687811.1 helix-turn-helix transcriptional regulator [Chitinophaga rhizophila]